MRSKILTFQSYPPVRSMEHLPNFFHDNQQFLQHNDMDVDISFFHHTQSVHVQSILHKMYQNASSKQARCDMGNMGRKENKEMS